VHIPATVGATACGISHLLPPPAALAYTVIYCSNLQPNVPAHGFSMRGASPEERLLPPAPGSLAAAPVRSMGHSQRHPPASCACLWLPHEKRLTLGEAPACSCCCQGPGDPSRCCSCCCQTPGGTVCHCACWGCCQAPRATPCCCPGPCGCCPGPRGPCIDVRKPS
jgi:hypothetical protein